MPTTESAFVNSSNVSDVFDNVAEQFFGSTPTYLRGDTKGQDVNYVKSPFDSVEELYQICSWLIAQFDPQKQNYVKI